jgi:oxygen-independent coproporphyrinogen-3 oxidase
MKLWLRGHDFKFAVEESIIALTGEKPEHSSGKMDTSGDYIISSLSRGEKFVTAAAKICENGKTERAFLRVPVSDMPQREANRLYIHALKLSLFTAYTRLRGVDAPWGALSGVRPSKLGVKLLEENGSKGAGRILINKYKLSADKAALVLKTAEFSMEVKRTLDTRDISLYVGIPFCPTRCAYCSFVSHSTQREGHLIEPYVETVLSELEKKGRLAEELGLRINTIYIGGGTPTVLTAGQLEAIMYGIGRAFDISALREYTVEAGRPDTITPEKLEVIYRHGAGRVSINPQSMCKKVLELAGRPHTPDDVVKTYRMARDAGFASVNMDIIAGLSGDSLHTFRKTVDEVIALEPENITVHTLALKRGSAAAERNQSIRNDEVGAMIDYANKSLKDGGYEPYYVYRQKYMAAGQENTGWSKPGQECVYNVLMMEELETIFSVGAGAVTKLVRGETVNRVTNNKYPQEYILDNGRLDRNIEKIRSLPL